MEPKETDAPAESHRRLAAIMFTDMVDYSALAQSDEAGALALLDLHNRLLRPIFQRFHGREVKTVGDAFLVEFESALDAARCALEVQRILHEHNASAPGDRQIRVRIGIHVGDVVPAKDDVLGDAVNIASRIQPLADPGGICLSQQAYDQVQNKIAVPIVRMPPVSLKNLRLPLTVYRIGPPGPVRPAAPEAGESKRRREIAVLPLANISPDPTDGYFADGLTEELISVLSQVRGLCVIARTSVAPYKATPKTVAEIGAELGVGTILEGSVRKAGNRIRITLQLIDVATQQHIWSSSYNREIDDVFAVQSDIAERTAQALRLELTKSEREGVARRPTRNLEAYDHYLRALVAMRQLRGSSEFPALAESKSQLAHAVGEFERATSLDPGFAEAFAAWANLYVAISGDVLPMREVMPRARELAERAIALDPDSSEAHAALANIVFQFDHDWARAEAEFGKAIALNPSNLDAHSFLGLMLFALGRFEEAKEEIRETIRLDPGGDHEGFLVWAEADAGNLKPAIDFAEEFYSKNPTSGSAHVHLGLVYLLAGRTADALREADKPIEGATDEVRFDHALLNALLGRTEAARAVVAAAEAGTFGMYVSPTYLAMMYSALGEKSRALDLLEKDFREGDHVLWLWYRGNFFDPIRDDPRFVALLRAYGLPTDPIRRPPRAPV